MLLRFKLLTIIVFSFVATYIPLQASAQQMRSASVQKKLSELEITFNGKIGVSAINTANNTRIRYRANERFPMGCTSKVMGVAAILKKSMDNDSFLQQRIMYTKKDLTNWTPITEKHLSEGMTIGELSAAAISYSDNTAMNLLAKKLGGPQGINAFARSIGDNTFRLDHWWPKEAMSGPGDLADSSTPDAMEKSLQRIMFDNVLAPSQRAQLLTWLKNNTTGDTRIRAGVPKAWIVGDKTGTGFYYGIANDIGIIWPPKCAPIIVAIYFTGNEKNTPKGDAAIAEATRIVVSGFAQTDRCIKSKAD